MIKVGITGGIGSGKSLVCEIFKLLGVAVFHADDEARILQNSDPTIKKLLISRFGNGIYTAEGLLDRKELADIVFSNTSALTDLNAIIHPAVRQTFLSWACLHSEFPYVLYEAAILLESGYAADFDCNILVTADEPTRIERVIRRDHTSESLVLQRIKNQMRDDLKIKMVDYIIKNDSKRLLIPQIIELDKKIKSRLD